MTMDGAPDQHDAEQPPRTRRAPKVLAWVAIGVAALLVAGSLTAYATFRDALDKVHRLQVTGLGVRPPSYNHSLNILVIGSDTRSGRNRGFGRHVTGQRSDTIMVLHLSPGFRRAAVLSVPRDTVVPVLSCPPVHGFGGQTAQQGHIEQINATFAAGGPGCLWKTIEHTTHIRLDHFMELNFTGFESVVNDLGGVNICLPYPVHNRRSRLHLSRGMHHVMGWEALAYWRVRYIGTGSDLQRIQRDQYLMASLAQKVKHSDLLGDPVRLYRVVSDVASALTTDSDLSQDKLISLAEGLRKLPLSAIHFVQVPTVPYPPNPNWVQWTDQASTLFTALAHDRRLPRSRGAAAESPRPSPTSSSSGLSGLGKKYGGISAHANVCRDSGAFAGPLGGH